MLRPPSPPPHPYAVGPIGGSVSGWQRGPLLPCAACHRTCAAERLAPTSPNVISVNVALQGETSHKWWQRDAGRKEWMAAFSTQGRRVLPLYSDGVTGWRRVLRCCHCATTHSANKAQSVSLPEERTRAAQWYDLAYTHESKELCPNRFAQPYNIPSRPPSPPLDPVVHALPLRLSFPPRERTTSPEETLRERQPCSEATEKRCTPTPSPPQPQLPANPLSRVTCQMGNEKGVPFPVQSPPTPLPQDNPSHHAWGAKAATASPPMRPSSSLTSFHATTADRGGSSPPHATGVTLDRLMEAVRRARERARQYEQHTDMTP